MSFTLWFTGLSGSGKRTLSALVHQELTRRGVPCDLLDAGPPSLTAETSAGASSPRGAGTSRRLALASYFLNKRGIVSIVAASTPSVAQRSLNRAILEHYIEVSCRCDVEALARRTPKGLCDQAEGCRPQQLDGPSPAIFQEPQLPDLVLETALMPIDQCVQAILRTLEHSGAPCRAPAQGCGALSETR